MQIRDLLQQGRERLQESSDTDLLDAQLLLASVLQKDKVYLLAHDDDEVSDTDIDRFWSLIERRKKHEPVAYLLGEKEFYGRMFSVSPAVLVPRPETELLVELALKFLLDRQGKLTIADLGTGSGCIGLTLAAELKEQGRDAEVFLVDASEDALATAKENAEKLGLSQRLHFLCGNWFDPLQGEQCDCVVSNPPYIAFHDEEVEPETSYEPKTALYAEISGLSDCQELVSSAYKNLCPAARMFFEFGAKQKKALKDYVLKHMEHYTAYAFHQDLAGRDRVLELKAS